MTFSESISFELTHARSRVFDGCFWGGWVVTESFSKLSSVALKFSASK